MKVGDLVRLKKNIRNSGRIGLVVKIQEGCEPKDLYSNKWDWRSAGLEGVMMSTPEGVWDESTQTIHTVLVAGEYKWFIKSDLEVVK